MVSGETCVRELMDPNGYVGGGDKIKAQNPLGSRYVIIYGEDICPIYKTYRLIKYRPFPRLNQLEGGGNETNPPKNQKQNTIDETNTVIPLFWF